MIKIAIIVLNRNIGIKTYDNDANNKDKTNDSKPNDDNNKDNYYSKKLKLLEQE